MPRARSPAGQGQTVITHADACELIEGRRRGAAGAARARRRAARRGRGRTVTFSAKVFVPLTNLCRDCCGYCTFRRDPGEPGAHTHDARRGAWRSRRRAARLGAKEALFSLGDKPEARFPEHREFLARHGHRTTLGYLRAMCALTLKESSLLPHANPGLMGERDLAALREVNVSMGIMLETLSERLLGARARARQRARQGPGATPAHDRRWPASSASPSPPASSSASARRRASASTRCSPSATCTSATGHIQEVIVQNFRAKPRIPMRDAPEPDARDLLRTLAVARLVLGPRREHPGAAEPHARRLRAAARGRAQRLGRHLAADARSHQPREALAATCAAAERDREPGLHLPRAAGDLSGVRDARRVPRRAPAARAVACAGRRATVS